MIIVGSNCLELSVTERKHVHDVSIIRIRMNH